MIALCFSTSFVVMSPLIDMATSRGSFCANGVPREGCAATHCSRRGGNARERRGLAQARERTSGAAPDLVTRFGRSRGTRRKDLQACARPLRVGPTRRILDPAVVQV